MMMIEWEKAGYLIKRELFEFRSTRDLAILGIFGLVQCIFMFSAREHGLMEDTILLFIIGGLFTVIAGFDLIARERETHVIDLLLTQGITRYSLFWVKWISTGLLSLVGAFVFCAASILGTALAGQPVHWEYLLREFGIIALMMEAYAAIALLCSTVFRRPKSALIAAISIWVVFRPPVISLLVIHPLQAAFSIDKTAMWRVVTFIPEFAFRMALDIQKGAPQDVIIPASWPYLALFGYVLIASCISLFVFLNQDEPIL